MAKTDGDFPGFNASLVIEFQEKQGSQATVFYKLQNVTALTGVEPCEHITNESLIISSSATNLVTLETLILTLLLTYLEGVADLLQNFLAGISKGHSRTSAEG
ncbi:hypothetical protein REPUB_Repub10bG0108100 [Reevesia pubescens]